MVGSSGVEGAAAIDGSLAQSRKLKIALTVLAVLSTVIVLVGFWPGSIGYDFIFTILESESWEFGGHQPPSAGLATWLLTFGTSAPSVLFVAKMLAYFGALAFLAWSRAPLLVKLGCAALLLSPLFLYLSPMLRSNTIEATFLGLAVAAGVSGKTRWHAAAAALALVFCTLYGQAVHLGHIALIALYYLWRFPAWSWKRLAVFSVATVAALWACVFVANLVTGNVDRSSTVYVSALNGIGGMVEPGQDVCLSQDIIRGGDITPERVYAEHYEHPYIYAPIWTEPVGFKIPGDLSPEQRHAVIDCWVSLVVANPVKFVFERLYVATLTLTASSLEPHFVTLWQGDEYLILNERFEEAVDVHPLGDAIIAYGRVGDRAKMGSILPYLLLYILSALAVLILEAKRRLLVLLTAAAVFGFMMPQLLFTQHPAFRYFVQAAHAASWMTLIHAWVLFEGRLGSPEFVASLKAAAARLTGSRAARQPGGAAD